MIKIDKIKSYKKISKQLALDLYLIAYPMPVIALLADIPFLSWYRIGFESILLLSLLSFLGFLSLNLYESFKK